MPGQTIEDVCRAEAIFVEDVAARHPEAEGKPVIIANCQAGWQIMMMAATQSEPDRPDHAGRLAAVVLGGRARQEPDALPGRYAGRHLADRAVRRPRQGHLRRRAPGRQLRIAQPGQHLLDQGLQRLFEGRHGERALPRLRDLVGQPGPAERRGDAVDRRQPVRRQPACDGQLRTSDGVRIDLRNITAPIIVFCSWGDNITPPQQALDWMLDLYDHEREIVENGQTIVYTMHQSIGHLGIFVSGKVATKEHGEFVSCMEMIDVAAARPLRGGHHRSGRGHRPPRPDPRQVPVPPRGADARRHPRPGRQRRRGRRAVCHGRARVRDQQRPLRDLRRAGCAHGCHRTGGGGIAGSASEPAALRHVLRPESADAAGEGLGGVRPRGASAGERGQSAAGDGAGGLVVDHHLPAVLRRIPRHDDRGDVPQHLWLAMATGAGRARPPEGDAAPGTSGTSSGRRAPRGARSELEHRFEVGGLEEAARSRPGLHSAAGRQRR